ncbi:hypothetical protein BSLG_007998 [Batrachochytrium salamandrivorans]|nr:hypothetical protein BSLG_007998 [Batrachochytrium salamandrivorans]
MNASVPPAIDVISLFNEICIQTPCATAFSISKDEDQMGSSDESPYSQRMLPLLEQPHKVEITTAVTYAQLDTQVASLAAALVRIGVQKSTYVGAALGRGQAVVVLALAIWRLNAVFIPLPSQNADALHLKQAVTSVPCLRYVVGLQNLLLAAFSGETFKCHTIGANISTLVFPQSTDMLGAVDHEPIYKSKDLAYIIRTSGTTRGRSGGILVRVPRSSISTNILEIRDRLQLQQSSSTAVFILVSAPTFDPFIIEVLLPLTTGGTLAIVPDQVIQSPNHLHEHITKLKITHLMATPSLFFRFSDIQQKSLIMDDSSIAHIILGGEPFPTGLLDLFRYQKQPSASLWNIYGTTECSVWASLTLMDTTNPNYIPQFYHSLDHTVMELRELNDGSQNMAVDGDRQYEVYLGGINRVCYLGNESIPQILRPTGDLAVRDETTGVITLLGRKDRQIKRSGYRIQLDSISQTIQNVLASDTISLLALIKNHLASTLSFYARPDHIFFLDEFPTTSHGKINYRELEVLGRHKIAQGDLPRLFDFSGDLCVEIRSTIERHLPLQEDRCQMKSNLHFVSKGGTSLAILGIILNDRLDSAVGQVAVLIRDTQRNCSSSSTKRSIDFLTDCRPSQKRQHTFPSESVLTPDCNLILSWGRACQVSYSHSRLPILSEFNEWKVDFKKCIDASPLIVVADDPSLNKHVLLAIIGSHSGMFGAVDVKLGSLAWCQQLPDRIESTACLWSQSRESIYISPPLAVVGCNNGVLYGVSIVDGCILRKFTTDAQIKSSPVVDRVSGYVLVGSYDHHLYALDFSAQPPSTASGVLETPMIWKLNLGASISSSPAIFIGSANGYVYGISADNDQMWSICLNGPIFSSPCIFKVGTHFLACVGSHGNKITVIDLESGTFVHQIDTLSPVFASPSAIESLDAGYMQLAVPSINGTVYVLRVAGGIDTPFLVTHFTLDIPVSGGGTGRRRAVKEFLSFIFVLFLPRRLSLVSDTSCQHGLNGKTNKALNEKNAKVLKELMQQSDNRKCADCRKRWVAVPGLDLARGIHRSLGTHISKVKSADLDTWTTEQIESMMRWGNGRANLYWEHDWPKDVEPPEGNIEQFIRAKYERKKYAMKGPIPEPESLGKGSARSSTSTPTVVQPSSGGSKNVDLLGGNFASFASAPAPAVAGSASTQTIRSYLFMAAPPPGQGLNTASMSPMVSPPSAFGGANASFMSNAAPPAFSNFAAFPTQPTPGSGSIFNPPPSTNASPLSPHQFMAGMGSTTMTGQMGTSSNTSNLLNTSFSPTTGNGSLLDAQPSFSDFGGFQSTQNNAVMPSAPTVSAVPVYKPGGIPDFAGFSMHSNGPTSSNLSTSTAISPPRDTCRRMVSIPVICFPCLNED